MTKQTLTQLEQHELFIRRHIGSDALQQQEMLNYVGAESLEDLTAQIVPESIRLNRDLAVGEACGEAEGLAYIKGLAKQNKVFKSYIGMGYYGTEVPNVILRNVLENPGWYTAYTPYQPEIAQGRLEAVLNFQQMSMDLSGLDLASASLLDEATAAAEAMALAKRVSKAKKANIFFVADDVFPQTLDVVKTRAECFGFEVVVGPAEEALNHELFGALFQYSGKTGELNDQRELFAKLREQKAVVAVAADIMSLVLLKSPGSLGADVVFGSAQRFGVPMGYGGPHAAFFVTRDEHKRSMPGRIIGVSKDSRGNTALRMAMQTREQHIRREKANSNICTAQILLANMASFYAVYHGPQGLKTIAERIHRLTDILAAGLKAKGVELVNASWFDTLTFKVADKDAVLARAIAAESNLRIDAEGTLGVSLDETTTADDLAALFDIILGAGHGLDVAALDAEILAKGSESIPAALLRDEAILTHPTFNSFHSETEMLRYIKRLENKDLALNHSMISLGSCTMKLNATAEMLPISWPEFANLHPFCPLDQAKGYEKLLNELSDYLVEITGYDAMCLQPNSGASGEYAGLLAIKKYHESRGEGHRNVCLIPQSAHGTNPASAQMAGMKIVVVACDKRGNVDMEDLRAKAAEVAGNLSCIMITYPSTHGVYEETVSEICEVIHQHGGQVYLDGANMNAQVGVTTPGFIGADVSHLNLHKTFAIPHGGGGPGMGPIGVKAHLAPFVAGHTLVKPGRESDNNGAVSAAPYGSASILPISWMYIKLLGAKGLRESTQNAMLNANYVMKKLSEHYPVLYRGRNDRVAHECIIDLRPLKEASGVTEMDVAKRLNDYGFHAPTMSFPVAGTLMIEPTESESKAELDRFIEAMVAIRGEIARVEAGEWPADNNPLHNAPHTLADIMDPAFDSRPYDRELAVFPNATVKANKFWPTVNRIDDVYGDRNLFCACVPMSEYE
ncbi:aminomethyl-transferring glycine dehydrogenase [Shewanella indica]|jgi:glycine dehydrogenase|uniref:Glycine dehydrogenase (decarboxylating) n=1 Tax=Shewanella indica TaxID=768528 RepID=A0ABU4QBM3_9GAMM|nr:MULTISPECIES: aminomethyl-transferring glycine dehydrogenase [Shewanella]MCA0951244.1 aminomethyl-transferring glycine dehydrogenase [Shewanella chilikensis]MCE9791736.1 aminomethyl-transferring glycine dehydrogenase [Shewanella indica]MDX6016822.1 aminomethyl-transferring glycine dehydrogenase [Shewanella indica]NDO73414.1 aminomethyl-transferring glycine dehydrogenase [Shewanella sp. SE1]OIN18012.1 glycine dehydrogenase (aminomethyl-transferring) [Shewanella algae]